MTLHGAIFLINEYSDSFLQWLPSPLREFGVFLSSAPPKVIQGPEDFSVNVGETIHISCIIDGLPSPSVTWATAEKTISPDDKYIIEIVDDTVTLIIKDATLEDTTSYTLNLENPVGTATFTVNVTVLGEYCSLQAVPTSLVYSFHVIQWQYVHVLTIYFQNCPLKELLLSLL